MGMISKFFINRPIFATVIAIVMVLVGLVTIYTLPVAQFPDITPPTVQVTAVYPGASAETVAKTVGVPIEEQVNGVDGMIYMSSSSSSSGSCVADQVPATGPTAGASAVASHVPVIRLAWGWTRPWNVASKPRSASIR